MKRLSLFFYVSLMFSAYVHADVYKCVMDGKSTYQASPCASELGQQSIKIKEVTENQRSAAQRYQKQLAEDEKNKAIQIQTQRNAAKDAKLKSDRQMIKAEEEALIREYFDKQQADMLLHDRRVLQKIKPR